MAYLPLANILHYRLRSALSALGIGIGICMLVTLSGLARGTLNEISDRWEAVDADLIIYPREWGENLITMSGIGLSDRYADILRQKHGDMIERVVPVFLASVKFAGQDQTVVGVDSDQWHTLTGGRQVQEGRLFDPHGDFSRWLQQQFTTPATSADSQPTEMLVGDSELASHGGMEIVIDSRLAQVGKFTVGQTVRAANHDWTIAGIVPAGMMSRVSMPRRTAQYVFGLGGINKSSIMFIKLRPGVDLDDAARKIRQVGYSLEVIPLRQYRSMLEQKFAVMYRYIDAVNAIAMVISFLFIMVTLYMMVLQRTREIAILKSCGASNGFILRQVLDESLILTGAGTVVGIAMSLGAGWLIQKFAPLYTVTITWHWIAIAVGTALAGALVSALYPAWRATRVDMVESLTLE